MTSRCPLEQFYCVSYIGQDQIDIRAHSISFNIDDVSKEIKWMVMKNKKKEDSKRGDIKKIWIQLNVAPEKNKTKCVWFLLKSTDIYKFRERERLRRWRIYHRQTTISWRFNNRFLLGNRSTRVRIVLFQWSGRMNWFRWKWRGWMRWMWWMWD